MKKILSIVFLFFVLITFASCNFDSYDFIDTDYHFNKAIIKMPDGEVITVDIVKWTDSDDGEQLTITSTDGNRYLVSSINCILIEENI